ncbi:DNA/RNA polymerase [Gigaspora margarita]|uniref:DNA/RNA polymerase n=1 Tax=Gigaspora margarita TaxID=4874 RepID=A0A8H4EK28_GIGMA|nr:DNA/RNA polymerase [Gigaspora margarita]
MPSVNASSSQVSSDSAVQEKQFGIDNPNSPLIPSHYKQKEIVPYTNANLPPLMCYVPDSLSTGEDSSSKQEVLCVNKPIFRRNKIISPFLDNSNSISPSIFYEDDESAFSDSDPEWYETTWGNKTIAYTFEENDSDNDEVIDEARRQLKLRKAQFRRPLIKSSYDLAGNAYLYEDGAKEDPRGYVATVFDLVEEDEPIRDILDYYYEERTNKQTSYKLGELQEYQYQQLLEFLERNAALFAWEERDLGCTNLIKHHINTGNALPIKHNPYRYSPAEKRVIKTEIDRM